MCWPRSFRSGSLYHKHNIEDNDEQEVLPHKLLLAAGQRTPLWLHSALSAAAFI